MKIKLISLIFSLFLIVSFNDFLKSASEAGYLPESAFEVDDLISTLIDKGTSKTELIAMSFDESLIDKILRKKQQELNDIRLQILIQDKVNDETQFTKEDIIELFTQALELEAKGLLGSATAENHILPELEKRRDERRRDAKKAASPYGFDTTRTPTRTNPLASGKPEIDRSLKPQQVSAGPAVYQQPRVPTAEAAAAASSMLGIMPGASVDVLSTGLYKPFDEQQSAPVAAQLDQVSTAPAVRRVVVQQAPPVPGWNPFDPSVDLARQVVSPSTVPAAQQAAKPVSKPAVYQQPRVPSASVAAKPVAATPALRPAVDQKPLDFNDPFGILAMDDFDEPAPMSGQGTRLADMAAAAHSKPSAFMKAYMAEGINFEKAKKLFDKKCQQFGIDLQTADTFLWKSVQIVNRYFKHYEITINLENFVKNVFTEYEKKIETFLTQFSATDRAAQELFIKAKFLEFLFFVNINKYLNDRFYVTNNLQELAIETIMTNDFFNTIKETCSFTVKLTDPVLASNISQIPAFGFDSENASSNRKYVSNLVKLKGQDIFKQNPELILIARMIIEIGLYIEKYNLASDPSRFNIEFFIEQTFKNFLELYKEILTKNKQILD